MRENSTYTNLFLVIILTTLGILLLVFESQKKTFFKFSKDCYAKGDLSTKIEPHDQITIKSSRAILEHDDVVDPKPFPMPHPLKRILVSSALSILPI